MRRRIPRKSLSFDQLERKARNFSNASRKFSWFFEFFRLQSCWVCFGKEKSWLEHVANYRTPKSTYKSLNEFNKTDKECLWQLRFVVVNNLPSIYLHSSREITRYKGESRFFPWSAAAFGLWICWLLLLQRVMKRVALSSPMNKHHKDGSFCQGVSFGDTSKSLDENKSLSHKHLSIFFAIAFQ